MEANSKSVEESTGEPSPGSNFNHTTVANPMLAELPTENETTSNTSDNADKLQRDVDRMDVIFKKHVKEGLAIQDVEYLS
ncbi:hypothetical protein G6F37_002545 [Rhizopus arrhizus]|nr:hypothetical protein G6F38_001045 [Rhizopus arrhizus]KAG1162003.1 hypothetical protein G6F37_002545 [Rhizopus arrhizus]